MKGTRYLVFYFLLINDVKDICLVIVFLSLSVLLLIFGDIIPFRFSIVIAPKLGYLSPSQNTFLHFGMVYMVQKNSVTSNQSPHGVIHLSLWADLDICVLAPFQ